jgi:hypothetical protein
MPLFHLAVVDFVFTYKHGCVFGVKTRLNRPIVYKAVGHGRFAVREILTFKN